nr:MBL fold metallo-hydrolase [Pseudomonas frederiksbergensis]
MCCPLVTTSLERIQPSRPARQRSAFQRTHARHDDWLHVTNQQKPTTPLACNEGKAAKKWLRETRTPVICTPHDAAHLAQHNLNVQPLPADHEQPSAFLGGQIRTIRCTHGRGLVGKMMEHGVGYLIEMPGEPRLYLTGDTLLTPAVEAFAALHRPDVSVVPAGGARFDLGGDIIMGIDEVLAFTQQSSGTVVANHLEALSHCPVTRQSLANAARQASIKSRLLIPNDGDVLEFQIQPQ